MVAPSVAPEASLGRLQRPARGVEEALQKSCLPYRMCRIVGLGGSQCLWPRVGRGRSQTDGGHCPKRTFLRDACNESRAVGDALLPGGRRGSGWSWIVWGARKENAASSLSRTSPTPGRRESACSQLRVPGALSQEQPTLPSDQGKGCGSGPFSLGAPGQGLPTHLPRYPGIWSCVCRRPGTRPIHKQDLRGSQTAGRDTKNRQQLYCPRWDSGKGTGCAVVLLASSQNLQRATLWGNATKRGSFCNGRTPGKTGAGGVSRMQASTPGRSSHALVFTPKPNSGPPFVPHISQRSFLCFTGREGRVFGGEPGRKHIQTQTDTRTESFEGKNKKGK